VLLLIALLLRRGSLSEALEASPWLYLLAPAASLSVFAMLGAYRTVFRFISRSGMYVACAGAALSTLLFAAANFTFLRTGWISANAVCIYGLLMLLYMLLSRSVVRELMSFRRGERERVAIYGAGAAGVQLARSLRESGQYVPVVFVDDEPTLWGRVVAGMRVRSPAALPSLIRSKGV